MKKPTIVIVLVTALVVLTCGLAFCYPPVKYDSTMYMQGREPKFNDKITCYAGSTVVFSGVPDDYSLHFDLGVYAIRKDGILYTCSTVVDVPAPKDGWSDKDLGIMEKRDAKLRSKRHHKNTD